MAADVGQIAVLRANGLGDYILAEPALRALRIRFPQAHITLIGCPWHCELTTRPAPIDEVVVAPPTTGVRDPGSGAAASPRELARFFAAMRERRFDLALQLHGGGRFSNPFARELGARWTVGLRAPEAAPLDAWVRYEYWQHEVARYLEVVELVGARTYRLAPHLIASAVDLQAARSTLATAGGEPDAPTAVLHPGASDPRRRWPAERFAAVGRALAEQGAQVVVVGDAAESELTSAVASACGGLDLGGSAGFAALVGLLRTARLVVANDSGPRHLADALGTSTVSVYWFGNVINAGPLTRHRHWLHVSFTTACPVCGANCAGSPPPPRCGHDVSFVADVGQEDVIASALSAWDG